MVWLIHKDEGNKDFEQSLLHRHSRNDAFLMLLYFIPLQITKVVRGRLEEIERWKLKKNRLNDK